MMLRLSYYLVLALGMIVAYGAAVLVLSAVVALEGDVPTSEGYP